MAARALVRIVAGYNGVARGAASDALLVVDAPATPSLLADAKRSASGDAAKALDDVAARLAKNPTR